MGFTPLAGLVMVTRSGSVDPGLLLWLLEHGGVDQEQLSQVLEHESGMKGLSGTSGDLRDVLAGREKGDRDCVLAFDVFTHRLCREVAAMTASAGGLDLLVLTGGVGERSADVRAVVGERLGYLGVAVDPGANRTTTADGDITAPGARVRTVVVTAAEEAEIARETRRVLGGS
jgi:acetate kinase